MNLEMPELPTQEEFDRGIEDYQSGHAKLEGPCHMCIGLGLLMSRSHRFIAEEQLLLTALYSVMQDIAEGHESSDELRRCIFMAMKSGIAIGINAAEQMKNRNVIDVKKGE